MECKSVRKRGDFTAGVFKKCQAGICFIANMLSKKLSYVYAFYFCVENAPLTNSIIGKGSTGLQVSEFWRVSLFI